MKGFRLLRNGITAAILLLAITSSILAFHRALSATSSVRGVVIADIDGSINPATDDFVKTTLKHAAETNAQLVVFRLNTPGGLLNSMQTIVENFLKSSVPVVVYVSPSGGSATSAGVFITMAAHIAVMAPGTTIGAAHPVSGGGENLSGDMRAKIENYAVSHIRAIAEQRGRNATWAEQAVRESVSVTDREAVADHIVDFSAGDLDSLLSQLAGRTVNVGGQPMTLNNVLEAPRENVEMTFRQNVVNLLSDPNIAILLGLGAMLGLGIELYHPGVVFPGVFGAICLVLSLTSAQILPIDQGGVLLLVLAAAFFVMEMMVPSFGIWGGAGIVCLVLGSIYLIDDSAVWGDEALSVNTAFVGSLAAVVGFILLSVLYVAISASRRKVTTGPEGLPGKCGEVKREFVMHRAQQYATGKVFVAGEIWEAQSCEPELRLFRQGETVKVLRVDGLKLIVGPADEN